MAPFANFCPSVVAAALFLAVHAPPTAAIALGQFSDFEDARAPVWSVAGTDEPFPWPTSYDATILGEVREAFDRGPWVGDALAPPEDNATSLNTGTVPDHVQSAGAMPGRSAPVLAARAGIDDGTRAPKPHVLLLLGAGLCAVVMRREAVRRGPLV